MSKTVIVKRESLKKYRNEPKPAMTPAHLRLVAQSSTKKLQEMAERRARGESLREDNIIEFTEWL